MPGTDRIDAAHPACRAWIGPVDPSKWVFGMPAKMAAEFGMVEPAPAPEVLLRENMPTCAEEATRLGMTLEQFMREAEEHFAEALIPAGHISAQQFAALAEVPIAEVLAAVEHELASALLPTGRLNLGHAASLAFMAARPFPRLPNGDPRVPLISGTDYLTPAFVGEELDIDHPVLRCWMARVDGRVRTDAELELT